MCVVGRIGFCNFCNKEKKIIEADIKADFDKGYEGILNLPKSARFGVYLAYIYYINLFDKIKKANAERVQQERIRVSDRRKIYLLFKSAVKAQMNLI